MEYDLRYSDAFEVTMIKDRKEKELVFLRLAGVSRETDRANELEIRVAWQIPDIGVHVSWSPVRYHEKGLVPCWGDTYSASCAMASAPVLSDLSYDDENRITIACSDVKNSVRIRTGLYEIDGVFLCEVIIHTGCAVTQYGCDIRIDTRKIPFYQALRDVEQWWDSYGYCFSSAIPFAAGMPMYSAWYSYQQNIDVLAIEAECRYFAELGCKALIIDDGWHTDKKFSGYDYCGDWEPAALKIPDMKAFVEKVHETGMKFILWYAVPFMGEGAKAYPRFQDKLLYCFGGRTHVLDPRYPEVREYLTGIYRDAVLNWDLDGLKLDFIDSFRQSETVREGMDYASVYDAVDRLLKDITSALKALKPDILVEFRHSYMGPLMRAYGTMLRAGDCACDSYTNRMNTLSLRLISGKTPVHSDMVMWNSSESPQQAAFQLTNVLFSVPQISVRHEQLTEGQQEMIKEYFTFWIAHRETLLEGEMLYKGYAANYLYVSARSRFEQIGAVYAGQTAYLEVPTPEIFLFNASCENCIFIDSSFTGVYQYTIKDCRGRETDRGTVSLSSDKPAVINEVPVNGIVSLEAELLVTHDDAVRVSVTRSGLMEDVQLWHVTAGQKEGSKTDREDGGVIQNGVRIRIDWRMSGAGIHAFWAPSRYHDKGIVPYWREFSHSCAVSGAPVLCNLTYDNENRLTLACLDAGNSVSMRTGLYEGDGCMYCTVILQTDGSLSQYATDIRIDTRRLPFYQVLGSVSRWWEENGLQPAAVPEHARLPVYSSWYGFHQEVTADELLEECRYFAEAGCRTLIVDDGWQEDKGLYGYDYCGDWKPSPMKIPDMKAFADGVHKTGMKFMLWYALPFVGEYSAAYARFKDKLLYCFGEKEKNFAKKTHVLDIRYPEVREYLVSLCRNAVLDWGVDGFKLDFLDSLWRGETKEEGQRKAGMDFLSINDAAERLLKEIQAVLKALNPDILIEFRHSYMGPLMRGYCNMLRSGDCALDSYTNRLNTLSLRLLGQKTPVHCDMVMWNYAESPEQAAFQLTHVLFSVPQISVRYEKMTREQRQMLKRYLTFWNAHRNTLLDGEMFYQSYAANFPYVSARGKQEQIGAVYAGQTAWLEEPTPRIYIVNAVMGSKLLINSRFTGSYRYCVTDCCGQETDRGKVTLSPHCPALISKVPVNGIVALSECQ